MHGAYTPGPLFALCVLGGSGRQRDSHLEPGFLAWLPRRSKRQISARPGGLRYFTAHRREQALVLEARRPPAN